MFKLLFVLATVAAIGSSAFALGEDASGCPFRKKILASDQSHLKKNFVVATTDDATPAQGSGTRRQ